MIDAAHERKARGAFFTPHAIAVWLARWAIRSATDCVLEPCCGEAAFVLAAGERLRALGTPADRLAGHLHAVEIHAASAGRAAALLAAQELGATITEGDFFAQAPLATFDAVIGNPPYIRYQSFSGEARARALGAALAAGVRLSGLAGSWAAFAIHASRFLRPEGRLALVLPGGLLSVNYAAEVRRFLLRRFGRVRLVLFDARVFPGVAEHVVLLLAEGQGGASHFELYQADGPDALPAAEAVWTAHRPGAGKWTPALIPADTLALYREFAEGERFAPLLDWGETWLGAVTGNNAFFALGRGEAERLGLAAGDLLEISPPGSRHLRGMAFDRGAWNALADAGAACFLFRPAGEDAAARRRIAAGQGEGVHDAYKCRVRSPWWRVPVGEVPDLMLTYMNQDHPRLLANTAGVRVLNSVYGVSLQPELRRLGCDVLPIAFLNSVTLLGAEMVGRSYGGGLLKLEPKEADRLPVPSPAALSEAAPGLRAVRGEVAAALAAGEARRATAIVDSVVLHGAGDQRIGALRLARAALARRRCVRRKRHARD